MNISSPVLYGAAVAIGAIGAGITTVTLGSGDRADRRAWDAKVDGMSQVDLAVFVKAGQHSPDGNAWIPAVVGASALSVGTAGLMLGAFGNTFSLFQPGKLLNLRPTSMLMAVGAGAAAGGLVAAGVNAVRD